MIQRPATTRSLALAAATALALASTGATAADPEKEIDTAATHAGYAAGSDDLKMVHTHLQHAINCIVGPKGNGFDASVLNPCKGLGDGALSDAKKMEVVNAIDSALKAAKSGLAADKPSVAQADAKEAASKLKMATSATN